MMERTSVAQIGTAVLHSDAGARLPITHTQRALDIALRTVLGMYCLGGRTFAVDLGTDHDLVVGLTPSGQAAEVIVWAPVESRMPDAEETVLVAFVKGTSGEPTWLGHFDGECWRDIEGQPIKDAVSHWARMVGGPHA